MATIKNFKEVRKALTEFSRFLEEDLRENLISNNFTGALAQSIKVRIDTRKFRIRLSFLEYGEYLDKGTKPHMVPVDAIRPWAKAKGLNEWAVAKSIAKKGTKAHPWLRTFLDAEFEDDLKKLLDKSISKDFDNWVKDIQLKIKN